MEESSKKAYEKRFRIDTDSNVGIGDAEGIHKSFKSTPTPAQVLARRKNWLKYCLRGASAILHVASESILLSDSIRRDLDKAATIVSKVLNNW